MAKRRLKSVGPVSYASRQSGYWNDVAEQQRVLLRRLTLPQKLSLPGVSRHTALRAAMYQDRSVGEIRPEVMQKLLLGS